MERDVKRGAATRERLLDAAITLFAEHGYAATTVGAVEESAGLAPRSGALYQYFTSKRALLDAALEREMATLAELPSVMSMLPLGDIRAELTLLARWNLQSLERRSRLSRFIRREGDQLPADVREELYEQLVREPYEQLAEWLADRARSLGVHIEDPHALLVILVESMSSYRTLRERFGEVPGDVDDDRFVATWVELCLAYAVTHASPTTADGVVESAP
jgi:AcrR family transcriptional regulator